MLSKVRKRVEDIKNSSCYRKTKTKKGNRKRCLLKKGHLPRKRHIM